MSVTQMVDIPDSHRLTIDVPHEVPSGRTILTFTPAKIEIEDVRRLLQKEMDEKGTSSVIASSGDGWEAHIRELYAES